MQIGAVGLHSRSCLLPTGHRYATRDRTHCARRQAPSDSDGHEDAPSVEPDLTIRSLRPLTDKVDALAPRDNTASRLTPRP